MNRYTATDIARITGAQILQSGHDTDIPVDKILTDSRTVFQGDNAIFFALPGIRHNGHDYILDLIRKGIKIFAVSQPVLPESLPDGVILLMVKDTLKALQALAASHRKNFSIPVIGITGSNGKTIIKEWLNELISDQFPVVKSPRSFNSQIGVPLSVWQMKENHRLAIFEAGISKPGEMIHLKEIISPDIGLFTNIGDAHQENFVTIKQKIEEKLTLFKHAKKMVYSTGHHLLSRMIDDFCAFNRIEKINWSFGNDQALIKISEKKLPGKTNLTARIGKKEFGFTIPFTDRSSVENACHCFAALVAVGADMEKAIQKFGKLENLAMRLEIRKGINNCLIINDYYNSDLESIEIALNVLKQQAKTEQLPKIVILSDIKQSGFSMAELYQRVHQLFVNSGVDRLVGIGPDLKSNRHLFPNSDLFYHSTEEFADHFNPEFFREAAILIKGAREFRFEKIAVLLEEKSHQTVLEINLNALIDNLNIYRKLIRPETKIAVMVKAFSYGSGDIEIAKILDFHKVDYLAVAVADEGVQLRKAGIGAKIIVMNPEKQSFQNIIDYQLEPNIYSLELYDEFERILIKNGINGYPVHIKIDTGMNRLGFKMPEEIDELGSRLKNPAGPRVQSIFSHLAASDDSSFDSFTRKQASDFEHLSVKLESLLGYKTMRHLLNSSGVERFPEFQYEMVRLGIGLYGISSTGIGLKNISNLKTKISLVKKAEPEETVGYSRSGKITRPSEIAVLPVGYADGLDRRLGNSKGRVFINGHFAPIIGNICMDMCMIDITGIKAAPGDDAEIFGQHIPVTELAEKCGTIPYEILTGISQRVKRTYMQE